MRAHSRNKNSIQKDENWTVPHTRLDVAIGGANHWNQLNEHFACQFVWSNALIHSHSVRNVYMCVWCVCAQNVCGSKDSNGHMHRTFGLSNTESHFFARDARAYAGPSQYGLDSHIYRYIVSCMPCVNLTWSGNSRHCCTHSCRSCIWC